MLSKAERIELIFEAIGAAPCCNSADEVLDLIKREMNAVEDAHSGVPENPENWQTDGRLYPPQEDHRRGDPAPGLRRYRSKGHVSLISDDGALKILALDQTVVFQKKSCSGSEVPNVQ